MYTESFHRNKLRILISVFLLFALPVYGETITVHGIPFRVEEKSTVQGGLVQVTVGGESKLLPEASVPSFIAHKYFKTESLRQTLSEDQIKQFADNAAKAHDYDTIHAILSGLFSSSENEKILLPLIDTLTEDSNATETLKKVMSEIPGIYMTPRYASMFIYSIGRTDLDWIRSRYSKLLYTHGLEIRFYLREKVFKFVREQDVPRALEVLRLFGEIFTIEDEEYKKLSVLLTKLESFKGTSANAVSLKDLAAIDSSMNRYIHPIFLDAVHNAAEEALKRGDFEESLKSLLLIDFERRTPRTHELILESIKNIPATSDILIRSPDLHNILKAWTVKDGSIKEHYAALLEKLALNSFQNDLVAHGRKYIEFLSSVRLDPSAFNDAIRIEGALTLYRKGKNAEAQTLLSDVKMSIPLLKRASLLWYKINFLQIFIFFIFLSLGIIFLALIRLRKATTEQRVVQRPVESYKVPTKQFVTIKERDGGLSREYIDCLRELNLQPTASLAEIKSAYRTKIKAIHPDHNSQQYMSFTEDLVRLKEVYEKSIMLRGRLGLGDEGIEED